MNKHLTFTLLLFLPNVVFSQMGNIMSKLEIFDLQHNERTIIYQENDHFEAPNWSYDGNYLILNQGGKLFKFDLQTEEKTYINTGFADKLNNDHGISPDGSKIVISHFDLPDVEDEEWDCDIVLFLYRLSLVSGYRKNNVL